MTNQADKIKAFRDLHAAGCFALPNPWDAGSARYLQALGFKALASTSAGFAWSTGRMDYQLGVEDVLGHLAALCAASDLPVNADFEGGFAVAPEGVAANVTRAVRTGVAGLSIEDRSEADADEPLFDLPLAVERIKAARAAIDATATGVLLTARCEGYLVGRNTLAPTIERLVAYAEAGADCLYAPGITADEDIRAVVSAVAPRPVNLLAFDYSWTLPHLADLGVRRVSLGGALARKAYAEAMGAAKAWLDHGTLAGLNADLPLPFGRTFGV
jgi:2-methylisocitrate lyase-like PEP mutase family enzyme